MNKEMKSEARAVIGALETVLILLESDNSTEDTITFVKAFIQSAQYIVDN